MDKQDKQDLSLDDILSEYAPGEGPAGLDAPPLTEEDMAIAEAVAHAESTRRTPARRDPDQTHTKVGFIQAADAEQMPMRVNVPSGQKPPQQPAARPVFADDTPKIRRMSDSTRAREIAKNKKKKKKGAKVPQEDYTYAKERPEGEYLFTQIKGAKRAKNRKKVKREPVLGATGTETIHINLKDVVPVKQAPAAEPVQPVEVPPAPRAQTTSLDLSAIQQAADPVALDVSITRTKEEAEAETRKRQERIDRMELQNVTDIRSDIAELRGAISFRILALTIVFFLSGYMALGDVLTTKFLTNLHPVMLAFIELLLGLAACVVCVPVLRNGLTRLLRFQADTDSLAAVSLVSGVVCCVSNVVTAIGYGTYRPYFLPCAVLALLLHSIGKLMIVNREITNLRFVTRRHDWHGLSILEDEQLAETLTRGVLADFPILAVMRHTDSLTDFRKYTYSADMADRFCRVAAPLVTVFGLAVSITMTVLREESVSYCLMLISMFMAATSGAALTFIVNMPMLKACRKMAKNGALMLGYQSVDDFYDTNALLIDAASLFPDGSVKLAGVKLFINGKTDEILLTAASLARFSGSILGGIFSDVLQGRDAHLFPVENYVYEDSMGLCGWIHSQRVLMGNRELMMAHNIEGLPSRTREEELIGVGQEGVYLSISGNLSALFLVEINPNKQTKYWAKQCVRHNMCMVVRSVDPMITINRLARILEVPQEVLKILPVKMFKVYNKETEPTESMSASLATTTGFSSVAQLIVGTKVIRSLAYFGIFIQAVTILLGIGIVLMEAVLHVGLTPAWMLILQLASTLLTLLAVNIRRIN
ncbi:MAG: hypothetical protein IKN55_12675 [Oscillospiraceae bacterium]|nr:hypothetical protein [Oscillospiraceae bacterium]